MIAAPASKPSAVVVVNPTAGRLSSSQRQEVIADLEEVFELEVFTTTGSGSGIELSRDAVAAGTSLVIAFGGDGVVNEVANGLAGTSAALGIIPGGTMNVLARDLGVPTDPRAAVVHLRALGPGQERVVHLGKMDDRYFTFAAGCGFDAETAELVESHLTNKRRFGEIYFYWSAFRVLAGTYRRRNPGMVVHGPFGEVPVSMAIACNAGPYAYLLNRPVNLAPDVHLEKGLDLFALKKMRIEALPLYAFRAAITGDLSRHGDAFYSSDLEGFTITSDEPFKRHVDGEPMGEATRAEFTLVRDILRVRA